MRLPLAVAPADPLLARRQPQGRGRRAQGGQPAVLGVDQIPHQCDREGGHPAGVMVVNQRVPDKPLARSADHQDAQSAHLAEMLRHAFGQQAGPASPRDGGAHHWQLNGVAALLDHSHRVPAAGGLLGEQG